MKKILVVLAALVALLTTSCVGGSIEGSGALITEDRPVSGFDHVSLASAGRVLLKKGEGEGVSIRADDNIMPILVTEVRDGTLHIGVKPRVVNLRPSEPVVFTVTFQDLSALSVSGSGAIDLSHLDAPFLELSVSGSGAIKVGHLVGGQVRTSISGSGMLSIDGTADAQTVEVSGSGGFYGQELVTRDTRITLSGSGVVIVNAQESLSAMISGSGTVRYAGDPRISESISGTGMLEPVE